MKQIIFNSKIHTVLDETEEHYVCEPENQNEGYHYISKNKVVIVNTY